ncbi:hypothetical protein [Devosia sp.]|uniref:hypothetical protein n=1 Tax=Devosia sp. TaxID=1871048 RepID=UPI003262F515
MRLPLAIAAFAALALPASAQMITLSPDQVGQIFCIGSVGNDMSPVEAALLTPDLQKAIAAAWAKSDAYEKANPGDMPPLGDGVPWRTAPDYADGCTVGAVAITGDTATVPLNYTFKDYPDANYTDTLDLRKVVVETGFDPYWRIDNIEYAEKPGTLTQALISLTATQ